LSEVSKRVAARQQRLAAFPGEGTPPGDVACELLCEDHVGTERTMAGVEYAKQTVLGRHIRGRWICKMGGTGALG
jgi:hypothetical protein